MNGALIDIRIAGSTLEVNAWPFLTARLDFSALTAASVTVPPATVERDLPSLGLIDRGVMATCEWVCRRPGFRRVLCENLTQLPPARERQ